MILWTFKLIRSVRKAIAGRKHPGQLAWGVALGALIGMIPHGNLLAVALVLFVLMLHVNHAMAALVGVAVSFLAQRLDPTFDALGRWCLEQPQVADRLALAWQYPLVPWTDLNNTIVVGSFLSGLVAVGPLYMITHPLFRAWAPAEIDEEAEDAAEAAAESEAAADGEAATSMAARSTNAANATEPGHTVHRIDTSHCDDDSSHVDSGQEPVASTPQMMSVPRPLDAPSTNPQPVTNTATAQPSARSVDRSPAVPARRPTRVAIGASAPRPAMATKMTVSRGTVPSAMAVDSYGSPADEQHKIDEALSYLLRQLRDSQDKDAA